MPGAFSIRKTHAYYHILFTFVFFSVYTCVSRSLYHTIIENSLLRTMCNCTLCVLFKVVVVICTHFSNRKWGRHFPKKICHWHVLFEKFVHTIIVLYTIFDSMFWTVLCNNSITIVFTTGYDHSGSSSILWCLWKPECYTADHFSFLELPP